MTIVAFYLIIVVNGTVPSIMIRLITFVALTITAAVEIGAVFVAAAVIPFHLAIPNQVIRIATVIALPIAAVTRSAILLDGGAAN